jgi:RNA-directed DNA polymerase
MAVILSRLSQALRAMRQTVRGWHLQLMNDKELSDLSNMFGPVIRGWANYYGRFHSKALKPLWRHVNDYLVRWMRRKHKHLARGVTRAARGFGSSRGQRAPFICALGVGILPVGGSVMGAG